MNGIDGRRPHTLELARFATGALDEQTFLAAHERAIRAVREAYPGLLGVTLVRLESRPGRTVWMDVASWASEEQARAAAAACHDIPEFAALASLILEEIGMEHGAVVAVR